MIGNLVFMVPPQSYRSLEELAEAKLMEHQPTMLLRPEPLKLLRIWDAMEDYLWKAEVVDALPPGTEGMTHFEDKKVQLTEQTYINLCEHNGRARFTAAHEFAHVFVHGSYARVLKRHLKSIVMYRRSEVKRYQDPEWQADAYAGALLMPHKAIRLLAESHPGGLTASLLVEHFHVSNAAANVRLDVIRRHF